LVREEEVEPDGAQDHDDEADGARLVEEDQPDLQDSRDSGVCTDTGVEPNRSAPPFASTSAMPSVRMICA
jgi:hypothetical protein